MQRPRLSMSFAVLYLLSPFSRRDNLHNLCTVGSSLSRLRYKRLLQRYTVFWTGS